MRKLALASALGGLLFCGLLFFGTTSYPYDAVSVADGGSITGTVKLDGVAPKPKTLEIGKDKEVCGAHPLLDQSLVVGRGGGIANAVVTITDIARGEPIKPGSIVVFDQKGCEYTPHVIAFPAGSTIRVLNSDGILHSIHTESSINPVVDMAQPGFKKTLSVVIAKPEAIKVTCDAHNWMEGWWYAVGNPYFAVTDAKGRFTIANVPPGTYTLRVWQEKLGEISKKVTIVAGMPVTADFTIKAHKN
jgi:plastocyanin